MFVGTLRDFFTGAKNESGAVLIMFGLMAVMLFSFAGMALDLSRAYHSGNRTMSALDSAALAAAKAMSSQNLTDAEVEQVAQAFFTANTQNNTDMTVYQTLNITIDRDAGTVTADVIARVPTTLSKIMNVDYIDVARSVTAVFRTKDIELAMMLDVTGSMDDDDKIGALKLAAKDVIDILLPAGGAGNGNVKVALAPYSASVNAGAYSDDVSDSLSTDGCVYERDGSYAYDDTLPAAGSFLPAAAGTPPVDIDPTEGIGGYACPNSEVVALSSDGAVLKSAIDGYTTGGWTAGHLGIAWAWYLVSPEWSPIWPVASAPSTYTDAETVKAVILMTDGIFNTAYQSANGESADQAIDLCNNMKTVVTDTEGNERQKVEVYAVAFDAPASAQTTLQSCASSPQHYFDASNEAELRQAFQTIALRLSNLRLSQ